MDAKRPEAWNSPRPMRTKLSIAMIGLAALVSFPAVAAAGKFPADGFLSPDGKTWCQGTATEVGCVSFRTGSPEGPGHGAVLRKGGQVVLCPESSAGPRWKCFQNFDETAPVLGYGHRAKIGGFRCSSARQGITCVLSATGKGFRIDDETAVAVRPSAA
jgi:hypothetical protein